MITHQANLRLACDALYFEAYTQLFGHLSHQRYTYPSMRRLNFKPPLLKPRPNESHKGSFGHLLVVGGDYGFGGAGIMAAQAALFSGAGKVSLATRIEHVSASLTRCPEIMAGGLESSSQLKLALVGPNAIVLGSGLGQSEWSNSLFEQCVTSEQPIVLDADGLNLLSQAKKVYFNENWVLTPHPAEAARLLGVTTSKIQSNRLAAARELHSKFGGIAVLKGAGTVICSSGGVFRCDLGNPAMATAGMGDVLSGIIGGLIAQGLPTQEAACKGVWAHAKAGDLAAQKLGRHLLATEILSFLRPLW